MNDFTNPYGPMYPPDNDPLKGFSDEERLKIAVWQILSYFVVIMVGLGICALLSGCATKRELHELKHRVVTADSLARQARQDTHVSVDTRYIDSCLTASLQQLTQEWSSHEQETETTTETITTAIDSLGRELRTEQRTTTRTLSREEQQRLQLWQQQMERQWQERYDRQDSIISTLENRIETHTADSTATQRDEVKQVDGAKGLTWWQRAWTWLRGILLGGTVVAIVIFVRRHLKRLTGGL